MFRLEAKGTRNVRSFTASDATILYKDDPICTLEEWSFACCGAASLHSFGYYNKQLASKTVVDEFIKFLGTYPTLKQTYHAKEIYFLLTCAQVEMFKELCQHPKVRKLDEYVNKAHGPYNMHLFRISCDGEFEHIPKQEKQ